MDTVTVNPNPSPARPAYQLRVLAERDDLAEKLSKLKAYLESSPTNGGAERDLLGVQSMIMAGYLDVLDRRIAMWVA